MDRLGYLGESQGAARYLITRVSPGSCERLSAGGELSLGMGLATCVHTRMD